MWITGPTILEISKLQFYLFNKKREEVSEKAEREKIMAVNEYSSLEERSDTVNDVCGSELRYHTVHSHHYDFY